jgi:plastocyanin
MRVPRRLSACLVPIAFVACSGGEGGPTESTQRTGPTVVASAAARFTPSTLTVPVNGTVTWRFEATPHNVTFRQAVGAPSNIGGENANTSVPRSFRTAGTFVYDCTLHPGMTGSVTVGQGSNQPPGEPPPGYPYEP